MADRTTASITVAAPRADVMAVIADFASYPDWASAVRSAEVIGRDGGGRASQVRFGLDAGVIKDSYVLSYDWDGDDGVRWDLAEPGSVITALSGGYLLADADGGTERTYDLAGGGRIPVAGMVRGRGGEKMIQTALERVREPPGGAGAPGIGTRGGLADGGGRRGGGSARPRRGVRRRVGPGRDRPGGQGGHRAGAGAVQLGLGGCDRGVPGRARGRSRGAGGGS